MSDKFLTDKTNFTGSVDGSDLIHIVDVDDLSQNSAGSSYKATLDKVANYITNLHGKTIYVDSIYGNDLTGLQYRPNKPFQTINAASAVASSGDLIYIRKGVYSENLNLITGVNYYFDNATLNGNILDNGNDVVCYIFGSGSFLDINITGDSNLYVECIKIAGNILQDFGTVSELTIKGNIIYSGTGNTIVVGGGQFKCYGDIFGSVSIINLGLFDIRGDLINIKAFETQSGTSHLRGRVIGNSSGTLDYVIHHVGGKTFIYNLVKNLDLVAAGKVIFVESGGLILKQTAILYSSKSTESVYSSIAQTIKTYNGAYANVNKGINITESVGALTVSSLIDSE